MADERRDETVHPSSLIPHPSPVAAILLAAGRARRMGAFKPLLPFGTRTVVEACVDNLLRAGVEEIVVVVGHRGDEVRESLRAWPVRFASNDAAASEMGESIARGVEQVSRRAGAVLIALADQPAVPPEAIKRIIEFQLESGAHLIVPEWQGRGGHPVLVDLTFREELLRLDPRRGLRGLFERHRHEVRRLAAASPYVARDLDTWEDYLALHREIFGAPPPVERPVIEGG